MKSISLFFIVHQPVRLKRLRFFDIGKSDYYYDDYRNETILRRLADNCYLPTNKILLDLIKKCQGEFKVTFSISGTAIDQFKIYTPEVIQSFQELAATGCVEFVAETYSHSLASIKDKAEFVKQVNKHADKMESLFGTKPTIFSNTELIYSDEIGKLIAEMGYKAILAEGPKHILNWRGPNYIYSSASNPSLALLLKNDMLSDDIAFRFSDQNWSGWSLTAKDFVSWMKKIPEKEKNINLFMDYETFGERKKKESGIFEFLTSLPTAVLRKSSFKFMTPSEVVEHYQPISALNIPHPISWADEERDLTAWLGNELQQEAFEKLYELSSKIGQYTDAALKKDWEYLQTSDHFYYMSTKHFSEDTVHPNCNPYDSPYDAFLNYMNVLNDFAIRLNRLSTKKIKSPVKAGYQKKSNHKRSGIVPHIE